MTPRPIRVLVTAVGGDFGQAIAKALRVSGRAFEVQGSDIQQTSAGNVFVKAYHVVPPAAQPDDFVAAVDAICRREGIQAVVPGSEVEIRVLCRWAGQALPGGAVVVCQPAPWIDRYGDELSCMRALKGRVDLAAFADGGDAAAVRDLVREAGFPLVVKLRQGFGSRQIQVVSDAAALAAALAAEGPWVVQELIDDQEGEHSVGLFAAPAFRSTITFRRSLGRFGCSWYAENVEDAEVKRYAEQVMEVSGLQGAANLQVRKSRKGVRLLEINPRFSSLVAARALAGFRDAEWSVRLAMGLPLRPPRRPYRPLRFQRFFHEVVDVGTGYEAVPAWIPKTRPRRKPRARTGVVFLGPPESGILRFLRAQDEPVVHLSGRVDLAALEATGCDFMVSHGYRFVIKPDVIARFGPRIVNCHISYLPWNGGADPNLWSFLETTPKGVTIHLVDAGIDTGPVLLQERVAMRPDDTMRSSYDRLQEALLRLFTAHWARIRRGGIPPVPQTRPAGTFHRLRDKQPYLDLLERRGWDTPVSEIEGGALARLLPDPGAPPARVKLVAQSPAYAALVVSWRARPEVASQMFSERPPTMDEHLAWLRALGDARREFVILAEPEGTPIGTVGLSRIDWADRSAEYGILIGDPAFRGKGYAREATDTILRVGFEQLGLTRIVLRVFEDNVRAVDLYIRLGFVTDRLLRQEVLKDGVRRDVRHMSLLRSQWQPKRTPEGT
jgi:methionyl-tRNA formyltransferase